MKGTRSREMEIIESRLREKKINLIIDNSVEETKREISLTSLKDS